MRSRGKSGKLSGPGKSWFEPDMGSTGEHLFYKDATNQNSVRVIMTLFEGLDTMDEVYAEYEVDEKGMVSLHNHMNTSSIWKSISQWNSGIKYTVDHPAGSVYIFDKNRGEPVSYTHLTLPTICSV